MVAHSRRSKKKTPIPAISQAAPFTVLPAASLMVVAVPVMASAEKRLPNI